MLLQLEQKIGDILTFTDKEFNRIKCKVVKAKNLCQNCMLYDSSINMCNSILCCKAQREDKTDIIIVKIQNNEIS